MKLLQKIKKFLFPPLTILNIYGFDKVMTRFVICHGKEIVDNLFQESPFFKELREKVKND
jgi:hypothetical protein